MPIYSRIIDANNVAVGIRGDFNSMKKQPEFRFRMVEDTINNNEETIKMGSLFPKNFNHTIPVMQCDIPLKTGITYPRALWEEVIEQNLYRLPVYGQKGEENTKVGEVTNMELRGNVVYATISIDTSLTWGCYAEQELAKNDKLFIKPFLYCHLNQYKEINPDDFILKSFYLVDYPEDIPEDVYDQHTDAYYGYYNEEEIMPIKNTEIKSEGLRAYNDFKTNKKDENLSNDTEKLSFDKVTKDMFSGTDKLFEATNNIFISKDMPTNAVLLERFNSVSDSENIFNQTSNI